jgi:hypothetical protein
MELDCAPTVHESNVFILLGIALSEKQIPLYNVVGVVKTHLGLFFESLAESRAVWRFLPDRSSQTLDAADGSRECHVDEAPVFKELRPTCRIPL